MSGGGGGRQPFAEKYEKAARIIQYIPLAVVALLVAATAYLLFFAGFSAEELLNYTPSNYFAAAAVILAVFAVKSLSVFFPIVINYVFTAQVFPIWAALIINFFGIAITLAIPYGAGRISGRELTSRLVARFDKKGAAERLLEGDIFYASYMLRIISILPADLVSMLFGASGVAFKPYFIGSMCGSVPSMIAITCMGATVTEPGSPAFIVSTAATVVIVAASMLFHRVKSRRKK